MAQATMIRTIENDPTSPFGEPEVPPAEWTYRHWRKDALNRGPEYIRAYLVMSAQRTGYTTHSMPEWPRAMSLAGTVEAFVNDGRWLWKCRVCNAAQVASYDDRRAFCVECFNAGDGWWPVTWPNDDDRLAIETVLSQRPDDGYRNWLPRESINDLQCENLTHGISPDAPGHMMIGNPMIVAQLRNGPLLELGFTPLAGPEDDLLDMDPAKADEIVFDHIVSVQPNAAKAIEGPRDGVDNP